MPSTNQGHGGSDRARYPEIKEEIGEDPARWLDEDLWRRGMTRTKQRGSGYHSQVVLTEDEDVSHYGELVKARIRGIDSLEVLARWQAVERDLGRGEDGGPRQLVIDLLQERASELEEIGERPDRLEYGPRRAPDDDSEDVDVEAIREERRPEASASLSAESPSSEHASDNTEAASLAQFATDGGEDV